MKSVVMRGEKFATQSMEARINGSVRYFHDVRFIMSTIAPAPSKNSR